MKQVDFKEIEKKVRQIWEKVKIYKTKLNVDKNIKKYILDMFPYPSWSGLHVGHWRWYVLSDVMAKIQKMEWKEVLHPMGFDSFWLPAENYAIKTGIHPKKTTFKAIETFRKQLDETGNWYDWDLEVITCTPDYYKWNQWIFLQFYKNWLAYKKKAPVNWCPSCKTVLANEQVEDWKCERCKTPIEKRFLNQWFFKITEFADRLYEDLNKLDGWPERVKIMQKNWIWKSEWSQFKMYLYVENKSSEEREEVWRESIVDFEVFTTRLDTVFGMTYVVFSPEKILELIENGKLNNLKNLDEVKNFCQKVISKPDIERTSDKSKNWMKLEGLYSINPFNGRKVEVWIADYVIGSYGTGVVMAVPAHDTRDWQFAKKYNLPIIRVIYPKKKVVFRFEENLLKDKEEAFKLADENELFYRLKDRYFYGWVDIRDEQFLKYWLKRFVNKDLQEIENDIFVWDKDGYVSEKLVFKNIEDFEFQNNTAYTKKGIVYVW